MSGRPHQDDAQRYDVLERISVGGMAEVFRARAIGLHGFEKPVAMKRILPTLAGAEGFEARFVSEAKLAATLTHANIVQVFDFGRFDGALCIVMEYVEGVDLHRLLQAFRHGGRSLPLPVAFQIAIEMCKGLEFAHGRGVVHRDVSPSNVLLSQAGEVKVGDFGIALVGSATGPAALQIMGKYPYMSPEQTQGVALDARSDLFSAGAVLFELFTGRRLFAGQTGAEVIEAVRGAAIPLASAVRPELPKEVDELLFKVLQRRISDRLGSAGDLLRALVQVTYAGRILPTPTELAGAVKEATQELSKSTQRPLDHGLKHILLGGATPSSQLEGGAPSWGITARESVPTSVERLTWVRAGVTEAGLPAWKEASAIRSSPKWLRARAGRVVAVGTVGLLGAAAAFGISRTRAGEVGASAEIVVPPTAGASQLPRPSESSGAPTAPSPSPPLPGGEHARRELIVRSQPPGADVRLDGRPVGKTPLHLAVLSDARAHQLELRKRGFCPADVMVTFAPGTSALEVARKLETSSCVGSIDLYTEPWANIYLRGKNLGEAPIKGLRLPHGRHTLTLINPVQNRQASIEVEVPARRPYVVKLK